MVSSEEEVICFSKRVGTQGQYSGFVVRERKPGMSLDEALLHVTGRYSSRGAKARALEAAKKWAWANGFMGKEVSAGA